KFVQFDDMYVSPKPLQESHPPFWCGGASDAALQRAARLGERLEACAEYLKGLGDGSRLEPCRYGPNPDRDRPIDGTVAAPVKRAVLTKDAGVDTVVEVFEAQRRK